MPNPADFTQFTGSVATYKVSPTAASQVRQNALSGGRAACWLVITKNGQDRVTTNTLSSRTPPTGGPTSGQGAVATLSVGATAS